MTKKKASSRNSPSSQKRPRKKATTSNSTTKRRCGLCGKTRKLVKTECCGNWICDDEDSYVMFSYARNSCSRNHRRYTLCNFHFNEQHQGNWQDCQKCRDSFDTEMYVYYGTSEFNFEVLPNPPEYAPTKCSDCGVVIVLGNGGYSMQGDDVWCELCTERRLRS